MESSVRYVQLPRAGQKPALCFRGSKSAYAIINEGGKIRSVEVDLKDYDKSAHVKSTKNGGEDYSPIAFREAVLRIIQRADSTVTARAQMLLDEGASLKPDDALPEEEPMSPPKNEEETEAEPEKTVEAKPKIRKLPKRVNREGQAEEPKRKLSPSAGVRAADADPPKKANGSAGAPRRADPERKPAALLPLPRKPAESTKEGAKAKASKGGSSRTLVAALASEAGLSQQPCRVKLRAAGLRAPYDEKNEAACRKALGLSVKGGKK